MLFSLNIYVGSYRNDSRLKKLFNKQRCFTLVYCEILKMSECKFVKILNDIGVGDNIVMRIIFTESTPSSDEVELNLLKKSQLGCLMFLYYNIFKNLMMP